MDLRHLEYFVAVAEELSFTAAARRLHVVQSAVSAGVRVLERELGVELFSRGGRQVGLTGAGTSLLPDARGVLAAAQGVRDLVADLQDGLRGSLRIATDGFVPVPVLDLAELFARFHATHPRVTLSLEASPGGVDALASSILNGRIDVGIATCQWTARDGISVTRIAAVPLVLVCHPGHRLASETRLALAQLTHEPFVDFPLGTGIRTTVDHAFAADAVDRLTLFEVPETATAVELVRRGLGVAIVTAEPAEALRGLHQVPVDNASLAIDVCVLAASRPNGAARALVAEVAGRLEADFLNSVT